RRRVVLLAGKESDRLGRAYAVEHVVEPAAAEVGEVRLLPRFLDAGEGELHAADVGDDFEAVLAELVAEGAGGAVKERFAGGDEAHASLAEVGPQRLDDLVQVGAEADALGPQVGEEAQGTLGAEHEVGGGEQFARAGGESGGAVAANAKDVDLRFRST